MANILRATLNLEEYMATLIVGMVILAAVGLAGFNIYRSKKKGGGCCGDCEGCSGCGQG